MALEGSPAHLDHSRMGEDARSGANGVPRTDARGLAGLGCFKPASSLQRLRENKQNNPGIPRSNLRFLEDSGLPYLEMRFETLLVQPENALVRLNEFFDVNLSMLDLKSVYNASLHRKSRSWKDMLLAAL